MYLTPRGIALLLSATPLLVAINWLPFMRWVALAYIVACVVMLLLDWRAAQSLSQRFELSRIHDQKLSLGTTNAITLQVRNLSARKVNVQIRDEPPDIFEISERILHGTVAGRETWQGSYTLTPLRRGNYEFGDLNLRWESPMRFIMRQDTVAAGAEVKVYPNLKKITEYDLMLRRNRLQQIGLRRSRQFGEGTEFESLREYTPDDDFRKIDWKATARRNFPVTVVHQAERSQNVFIALDAGRMMQSPIERMAKLDFVINSVLLFAYVATAKGDKVGMLTFGHKVDQFLPSKAGRGQFQKMLEALYAVEPQPVEPDYQQALSYLRIKQRKRALVILFTDLSGGESMQQLVSSASRLAKQHLPMVVTINDPAIYAAAHDTPTNSFEVYQRAAAIKLLNQRKVALETLSRNGVLTLDVPAHQLSMAVINRYLDLKARGRL